MTPPDPVTSDRDRSEPAEVTAPALTVLAVILFMGAVSGAHLNPVVSIAFALRGDFGWRRIPGYVVAQLAGAVLAAVLLRVTFGNVVHLGGYLRDVWVFLGAPPLGAVLAVGAAYILRGPGGGPAGSRAAQGTITPPTTRGR